MNIECYENLANAIVEQAVKDYIRARRVLKKNKDSIDAKRIEKESLNFFHSNWFNALTDINSDILIKKINEEVFKDDSKAVLKTGKIS